MRSLLSIPYPRKSLSSYIGIVTGIGLTVNFILMVFQPFGTATFHHPHKFWILSGYGISIALAGALYYIASFSLFHRDGHKSWNIVSEVVDLFLSALLSMIATYVYYKCVFGGPVNIRSFLEFLLMAGTVALIPVLISFFYLYFSWKDVISSQVSDQSEGSELDQITLITGQNKTDKIKTKLGDLILAKAQDNYVMLYVKDEKKIQKHLIRSTLTKILEQLDDEIFVKTHRSYFVNRHHIKNLAGNKSKAAVIIADIDKDIPVSRSMYDQVKTLVNN